MLSQSNTARLPADHRRLVLCLILVSLVAKVALGWWLADSFLARGNSYTSLNALALNMLAGGEFAIEPALPSVDYEPGYPALLATGYGLTGTNWLGVTLIQVLLYAATSWMLFSIGARVWNPAAGAIAAVYHSFYPFLFVTSLSVVDTTLFIFLWTALVLVVLRLRPAAGHVPQWRLFALLGLLPALMFLVRGSAIALVPATGLVLLWWLYREPTARRIAGYALALGVFLGALAPWLERNHDLTGKLLIATHGPFGVWQGNNDRALDYIRADVSLDRVYQVDPPQIYRDNPLAARPPAEAVEVASRYSAAATRFIRENPGEFLHLAYWKFVKLWSPIYNPAGETYTFGGTRMRVIANAAAYIPLLILLPIGAAVLIGDRNRRDIAALLIGTLLVYTAAHMIAMGYTRLRLPVDPLLMVLAGVGLVSLMQRTRPAAQR